MVPFQSVVRLLSDWSNLTPDSVGGSLILFTYLLKCDLNTRVFSDQACNMAPPHILALSPATVPSRCGLGMKYSPPQRLVC